jgi:hypothetical protein
MSLKLHFMHSHLDFFPVNMGAVPDEHAENAIRIYLKWKTASMENGVQKRLADCSWGLTRATPPGKCRRQMKTKWVFYDEFVCS